ncbi:hypothetical protein [Nonomuraea sp. SYSU D8015]|uniref:hypothetical protein n=1 Tax=Nonomuraea sp. SYSU D8015 TaxID=2593644 RepID=UPI0016618798|nr:hypothetical protein [Nonomuraea sp. SYSU D8015]
MLARRGIDKPTEEQIAQAAADLLDRAEQGPGRETETSRPAADAAQEDHYKQKRLFAMTAIKDVPYLATAIFCGLLMISDDVLIVGIPLWIASHPDIPAIFSTSLAALSTGIIVLLQMRLSKAVSSQRAAVRRFQFSGRVRPVCDRLWPVIGGGTE